MIVDSSVWIGLFQRQSGPAVALLDTLLRERYPVYVLPVILQEVLQGAASPEHFDKLQLAMGAVGLRQTPDAIITAKAAAHLYAECRWAGVTPRSPIDCLIATCAMELDMPLLHRDRDFDLIASVSSSLKIVDPGGASRSSR